MIFSDDIVYLSIAKRTTKRVIFLLCKPILTFDNSCPLTKKKFQSVPTNNYDSNGPNLWCNMTQSWSLADVRGEKEEGALF